MDLYSAKASTKKWVLRIVIGVLVLGVGGSALYTLVALNFSYSKGDRVGFVQKLSKRGWVCKTNEGDLAKGNVVGQQAQMFSFTVPDDKVAS